MHGRLRQKARLKWRAKQLGRRILKPTPNRPTCSWSVRPTPLIAVGFSSCEAVSPMNFGTIRLRNVSANFSKALNPINDWPLSGARRKKKHEDSHFLFGAESIQGDEKRSRRRPDWRWVGTQRLQSSSHEFDVAGTARVPVHRARRARYDLWLGLSASPSAARTPNRSGNEAVQGGRLGARRNTDTRRWLRS